MGSPCEMRHKRMWGYETLLSLSEISQQSFSLHNLISRLSAVARKLMGIRLQKDGPPGLAFSGRWGHSESFCRFSPKPVKVNERAQDGCVRWGFGVSLIPSLDAPFNEEMVRVAIAFMKESVSGALPQRY